VSLRSVRRRFAALKAVPSQIATQFAAYLTADFQTRHDAGLDPFDEPWAELRPFTLAKGRTPPPLDEFGAMRASATATPTQSAGVKLAYDDPKSGWAQDGADNRAVRQVLPDTMPPRWAAELKRIANEKVKGAK